MIFASATLAYILAAAATLGRAASATSRCPAEQSNSLCCRSLGKFSDNSYVWTNICGITGVDPNTSTASGCSIIASWYVYTEPSQSVPNGLHVSPWFILSPTGAIAACCETLIST
ncbi:hypothetical protein EW146_g5104 [Bondarzewia mesenterica]|uniref:Hydrophobin n=1 Tax=Bondarzewia mesenterica TaxID=1095465 RepID=A0A4S4LUB1_9AGAM|nr:hypothetical protein EW146_g5104 [Bondarzewia mesenterica]